MGLCLVCQYFSRHLSQLFNKTIYLSKSSEINTNSVIFFFIRLSHTTKYERWLVFREDITYKIVDKSKRQKEIYFKHKILYKVFTFNYFIFSTYFSLLRSIVTSKIVQYFVRRGVSEIKFCIKFPILIL